MPLTRSLNGINAYENFKSAYGNTALYNELGGDAGFSDAIGSNDENTINMFMSAVMSADELGGIEAFRADYNTQYLTNYEKLNAVANELWGDRTTLNTYERYKTDDNGNYILNEAGTDYLTESYQDTAYNYSKEYLQSQGASAKEAAEKEAQQIEKDSLNFWTKLGRGALSVFGNLGATILDTFKDGVMFIEKTLESTWNKGALRTYMSNETGYGAGMFSDMMADIDTQYTVFRDVYGNTTTVGDVFYGIANTFGEMLPTMVMQMGLGGIEKAALKGVESATTAAKITKGFSIGSKLLGTSYWYNLGVSNIKDYVAASPDADMWQICISGFAVAAVQAGVTYAMSKTIGVSVLDKATLGIESKGADMIFANMKMSNAGVGAGIKHFLSSFITEGYKQAVEEEFQELGQYLVEQVSTQINSNFNAIFEINSKQFFNAAAMAYVTSFISTSFNYLSQFIKTDEYSYTNEYKYNKKKLKAMGLSEDDVTQENVDQFVKRDKNGNAKYRRRSVAQTIDARNIVTMLNEAIEDLKDESVSNDDPRLKALLDKLNEYEEKYRNSNSEYNKLNNQDKAYQAAKKEEEDARAEFDRLDEEWQNLDTEYADPTMTDALLEERANARERMQNARTKLDEFHKERRANKVPSTLKKVQAENETNKTNMNQAAENLEMQAQELEAQRRALKGERHRAKVEAEMTAVVNALTILGEFYNAMGDENIKGAIDYLDKLSKGEETTRKIRAAGGYRNYIMSKLELAHLDYTLQSYEKLASKLEDAGVTEIAGVVKDGTDIDEINKIIDDLEEKERQENIVTEPEETTNEDNIAYQKIPTNPVKSKQTDFEKTTYGKVINKNSTSEERQAFATRVLEKINNVRKKGSYDDVIITADGHVVITDNVTDEKTGKLKHIIVLPYEIFQTKTVGEIIRIGQQQALIYAIADSSVYSKFASIFKQAYGLIYSDTNLNTQLYDKDINTQADDFNDATIIANLLYNGTFILDCLAVSDILMVQFIEQLPAIFKEYINDSKLKLSNVEKQIANREIGIITRRIANVIVNYAIRYHTENINMSNVELAELKQNGLLTDKDIEKIEKERVASTGRSLPSDFELTDADNPWLHRNDSTAEQEAVNQRYTNKMALQQLANDRRNRNENKNVGTYSEGRNDFGMLADSKYRDVENTNNGQDTANDYAARVSSVYSLYRAYILDTYSEAIQNEDDTRSSDKYGTEDVNKFLEWVHRTHPAYETLINNILKLDNQAFNVSFEHIKNAQKLIDRYIDKTLPADVRGYATINDLIKTPELLKPEIQEAIRQRYGELTPINTFYYLKNNVFFNSLNENQIVTITKTSHDTFIFTSVDRTSNILNPVYNKLFSAINSITSEYAPEDRITALKIEFDENVDDSHVALEKTVDDNGDVYLKPVLYIPATRGTVVLNDKTYGACYVISISEFIDKRLLTNDFLKNLKIYIQDPNLQHEQNSKPAIDFNELNARGAFIDGKIIVSKYMTIETVLHEFTHALQYSNQVYCAGVDDVFRDYRLSQTDSQNEEQLITDLAKDIIAHDSEFLEKFISYTEKYAKDEQYEDFTELDYYKEIITSYIYYCGTNELVARTNFYMVNDITPISLRTVTYSSGKSVLQLITGWGKQYLFYSIDKSASNTSKTNLSKNTDSITVNIFDNEKQDSNFNEINDLVTIPVTDDFDDTTITNDDITSRTILCDFDTGVAVNYTVFDDNSTIQSDKILNRKGKKYSAQRNMLANTEFTLDTLLTDTDYEVTQDNKSRTLDIAQCTITFDDGTQSDGCVLNNGQGDAIITADGETHNFENVIDIIDNNPKENTTATDNDIATPEEIELSDNKTVENILSGSTEDFYSNFRNLNTEDQIIVLRNLITQHNSLVDELKDNPTNEDFVELFKLETRILNLTIYTLQNDVYADDSYFNYKYNNTNITKEISHDFRNALSEELNKLISQGIISTDNVIYKFIHAYLYENQAYLTITDICKQYSISELQEFAAFLYNQYLWNADAYDTIISENGYNKELYSLYNDIALYIMRNSNEVFSSNEYTNMLAMLPGSELYRQLSNLTTEELMDIIGVTNELKESYPMMQRVYNTAQTVYGETISYTTDKAIDTNKPQAISNMLDDSILDDNEITIIPNDPILSDADSEVPNWTNEETELLYELRNALASNANTTVLMHMIMLNSMKDVLDIIEHASGSEISAWIKIFNSNQYTKIAARFDENIRDRVKRIKDAIFTRATNRLITSLSALNTINTVDSDEVAIFRACLLSDNDLQTELAGYSDKQLWYYNEKLKILRNNLKNNVSTANVDLELYRVENAIESELNNRTDTNNISYYKNTKNNEHTEEEAKVIKAETLARKRNAEAKAAHKAGEKQVIRTTAKQAALRDIKTTNPYTGKLWKAQYDAQGRAKREVPKYMSEGTNIEKLGFVKKNKRLEMSAEMQEFIVSLDLNKTSDIIKDAIRSVNKNAKRGVFNKYDLYDILRTCNPDELNEYTFGQINKYFFMNKHVKTLEQLQQLTDTYSIMYWAVAIMLTESEIEGGLDNPDAAQKQMGIEALKEIVEKINKSTSLSQTYADLLLKAENIVTHVGDITIPLTLNLGNLRIQILNTFDGTPNSMRHAYNNARWLAASKIVGSLSQAGGLNTPGEFKTTSLDKQLEGARGHESERTLEETLGVEEQGYNKTEAGYILIGDNEISYDEMIDAIVEYDTEHYYQKHSIKGDYDYKSAIKRATQMRRLYTKYAYGDEETGKGTNINQLTTDYLKVKQITEGGIDETTATNNSKAINKIVTVENRASVINSIKRSAVWLKNHMTGAQMQKNVVDTYPDIFNKDGTLNPLAYRNKNIDTLVELRDKLNGIKEEFKANSFTNEQRIKELQQMERQNNRLRKHNESLEKKLQKSEEKIERLTKRLQGKDSNNKDYSLFLNVNNNEEVPEALVKVLQTDIENPTTNKRDVQFAGEAKNAENLSFTAETFMNANEDFISKLSSEDKEDIIAYLYNHLGTPDGTSDAVKIYDCVTLWTLAYLKHEDRNGNVLFDNETRYMLDKAYSDRASRFGLELHAVNDAIAIINPNKRSVEYLLQTTGIEYTEEQVDALSTILNLSPDRDYSETYLKNHGIDTTPIAGLFKNNKIIPTPEIKQKLATTCLKGITQTAIENARGKTGYERVMNKIVAFEQMCLLSWPGTWLRNLTSNAILREFNRLGDWIGKGFTAIPGVKSKVAKGKSAINSKRNLGVKGYEHAFLYNITGTKVSSNMKTAVKALMNTPIYTDERGKSISLYEAIEDGMTRYNDVMFNSSNKNKDTGETLTEMIMSSISMQVFNYHKFDTVKDGAVRERINGVMNKIASWTFKMLSDDPFIGQTTRYLFERMLTEKEIAPSDVNINNKEVLNMFAQAYTEAAYQYIHRTSFLKKLESTVKSKGYGGVTGWFVLKQFMPFMNATWNWGVEALNYSPYGLVKGIMQILRLEKTFDKNVQKYSGVRATPSPNFTLYNARQTLGKGVIGTALMGLGAALAACGVIALDDEDDKMKIYVGGNTYIDVSDVFGSSSFLAGAVLVWDIFRADDDMSTGARLWTAFDSCLSYLFEDTLFNDMFNSFRYSTSIGDWLTYNFFNMFGNFVPNIWKQLIDMTHSYEINYSSGVAGQLQRLAAKVIPAQWVPGVQKQYDPYTGEVKYNYKAAWFTKFWNKLSPIDIEPYKVSDLEMTAVSLGVSRDQLTGNYTDIGKLTNKQKAALNKMYGKLNEQELTKLIRNKTAVKVENDDGTFSTLKWSKMTDTQKASAITSIMNKNATYAKIYVYTSSMGGKYYASDSEYTALKSFGIIGNVYRETGRYKGFV